VETNKYLEQALLWCAVANYGILILWYVLLRLPHGWMLKFLGSAIKTTQEDFDRINLAGIVFYKVANFMFFLIPFIVVHFLNAR